MGDPSARLALPLGADMIFKKKNKNLLISFQIKQGRVLWLARGAFRLYKGHSELFIRWNLFPGPESHNPCFFGDLSEGMLGNCVGWEQSLIVQDKPLHGRIWNKPGSLANLTYMPKVCSDQESKKEHCDPRARVSPSEKGTRRKAKSMEVGPMGSRSGLASISDL